MEELYGYHIVLTTHNSRTSQRMIKYKVSKGPARTLCLKEEIILTKIIGDIVNENQYRVISYNICRDHVHLLLVCPYGQLTSTIQKLKSVSSKLFHRHEGVSREITQLHSNRLWSQKFFRANLDQWTLAKLSSLTGEVYKSTYLQNAISYINNNRKKHNLIESTELNSLIEGFTITVDEAYNIHFNGS